MGPIYFGYRNVLLDFLYPFLDCCCHFAYSASIFFIISITVERWQVKLFSSMCWFWSPVSSIFESCFCHSLTWLWLWPSNALEPTPLTTQTFNCQYLSHFSTNWAEIFFGDPPVGFSNVKTTKNFKLLLGASTASFVGHCQHLSHFPTNWAEIFL